jgi:hypothetical protein
MIKPDQRQNILSEWTLKKVLNENTMIIIRKLMLSGNEMHKQRELRKCMHYRQTV